MKIEGKVVLIGNIYIAPGNENQLHHLDNELEQHKDKSILLVGDFNSCSNTWDKNIRQSNKMGKTLEDIIRELQAIRIGTTYAKENISISTENLHIFVDSQAAIQAIIEQNHKNYHNITITEIRQNLINISHSIKSIKFV